MIEPKGKTVAGPAWASESPGAPDQKFRHAGIRSCSWPVSLHRFVQDKRVERAMRLDLNPPSRQQVDVGFRLGPSSARVRYELLSLPIYMAEFLPAAWSVARPAEKGW